MCLGRLFFCFDKSDRIWNARPLWGRLKDALKVGLSIPDDEKLAVQLSSPKYSFDSADRIVIERKQDMKKRGVDSPDRADALCLTYYQNRLLFAQYL